MNRDVCWQVLKVSIPLIRQSTTAHMKIVKVATISTLYKPIQKHVSLPSLSRPCDQSDIDSRTYSPKKKVSAKRAINCASRSPNVIASFS